MADRAISPSRFASTALLALALASSGGAARALESRELAWENLLPEALIEVEREAFALQRHVSTLPAEARAAFQLVAIERNARQRLASGFIAEDELTTREREALAANPSENHPDALALWEKVEATRALLESRTDDIEPALDGAEVRIPGYVLPLEFDGTEVREFLLVPYVGACIHSPPPPANQIVFVRPEHGFVSQGLFSPVWVEGRLSAKGGTHDLSFVDGQAPIDVGYSLDASTVEPYRR